MCFEILTFLMMIICVSVNSKSEYAQLSFDNLYKTGLDAHKHRKWLHCVLFIKKAIQGKKDFRNSLVDCKKQCRNTTINFRSFLLLNESSSSYTLDYNHVEKIVKESECLKKCKYDKLEDRNIVYIVKSEIQKAFDTFLPYSILEKCYAKVILFINNAVDYMCL